jgi:hypothetical protein
MIVDSIVFRAFAHLHLFFISIPRDVSRFRQHIQTDRQHLINFDRLDKNREV